MPAVVGGAIGTASCHLIDLPSEETFRTLPAFEAEGAVNKRAVLNDNEVPPFDDTVII